MISPRLHDGNAMLIRSIDGREISATSIIIIREKKRIETKAVKDTTVM